MQKVWLNLVRPSEPFGDIYLKRGVVYLGWKEFSLAIADFTETIELEPSNARAYYVRGIAYQMVGNRTLSDKDFQKAESLQPGITKKKLI